MAVHWPVYKRIIRLGRSLSITIVLVLPLVNLPVLLSSGPLPSAIINTMSLPVHQRAVVFNTGTNSLSFSPSYPMPINTNELLIYVHSTAITNGELTWGPFVNWPQEHIPCYDVSGTIIGIPDGCQEKGFRIGDQVHGRVMANREGTAREYATILPSEPALVPEGLGMLKASSVPMSAHTAWQALFEHGELTGSFALTSLPRVNGNGQAVLGQEHCSLSLLRFFVLIKIMFDVVRRPRRRSLGLSYNNSIRVAV